MSWFLADLRHLGPESACSRLGFDATQADAMMRKLLDKGGALELAGVGRHLQILTADALTNTWFSIVGLRHRANYSRHLSWRSFC